MKSLAFLFMILFTSSIFANQKECFGTEPFWAIKIESQKVIMTDYTVDEPISLKIISRQTSTGSAGDMLEIVKTEKNTIVTRKALCNDGKSDREYDYEVTIFDNNSQLGSLVGCCK